MKVTTNVWGGMSPTHPSNQDPLSPSSGGLAAQLSDFVLSGNWPPSGNGAQADAGSVAMCNGDGGGGGGGNSANITGNETLELNELSEEISVGELKSKLGSELYKVSRLNYGETLGLPPSLGAMHLFWKGYELRDETKTLRQLRIASGSTVLAKFAMVSRKASVPQLCLGTENFLLYEYYKDAGSALDIGYSNSNSSSSLGTYTRLTLAKKQRRKEKDSSRDDDLSREDESGSNDENDNNESNVADDEAYDSDDDDAPSQILVRNPTFNRLALMFLRGEAQLSKSSNNRGRELCLELLNLVPRVSKEVVDELLAHPLDTSFTQEEDKFVYLYKLLLVDAYIHAGKKVITAANSATPTNVNAAVAATASAKAEFELVCERFERGGGVDILADVILPCAISKHEAEEELGHVSMIYKFIIVHAVSILHYFIVERDGATSNHREILTTPFMEQCFCVLKIISPDPARSGSTIASVSTSMHTGEAVECASVLCTIGIICECIQENPDESLNVLFSSTGIRSTLIYTVPAILNKYSPLLRSKVAQGLLAVFEKILEVLELLNYTFENDSLLDFFLHAANEAEKSKSASESFFALFDALIRSRLFPPATCLTFFAEKLFNYHSPEASLASQPDVFLDGILTLIASSSPRSSPSSPSSPLFPVSSPSSPPFQVPSSPSLSPPSQPSDQPPALTTSCGENDAAGTKTSPRKNSREKKKEKRKAGTKAGSVAKKSDRNLDAKRQAEATMATKEALVEELYENCLMRVPYEKADDRTDDDDGRGSNIEVDDMEESECKKNDSSIGGDWKSFPKCKASESRARAYAALRSVLRTDPCLAKQLTVALVRHIKALNLNEGWNYPTPSAGDPLDESCSGKCGALGLKNLGATCYMNAVLQQLYMTPKFRDFVLSVEGCPNAPAGGVDFDLLFQLQALFSSMRLQQDQIQQQQQQQQQGNSSTVKSVVDTSAFCHTLKVHTQKSIFLICVTNNILSFYYCYCYCDYVSCMCI